MYTFSRIYLSADDLSDNGDNHDLTSEGDDEPVQLPVRTP